MVTYEFTLERKEKKDGKRSIIINFIKNRKNTSLSIRKACFEKDWSYDTSRVKKSDKNHKLLNEFISRRSIIIDNIIDDYDKKGISYTLSELICKVKTTTGQKVGKLYSEFHSEIIDELTSQNKLGSAKIEKDTLNSIRRYFNKENIGFNEISFKSLKDYEIYSLNRGNSNSTIAIRMRHLRSIFNKAINSNIISKNQYPFEKYKISVLKTNSTKEVLTQSEITRFFDYIPESEKQTFAKDVFFMSYYGRGINFLDLLKLEKRNLYNNRVSYLRSKTNAQISFHIPSKLQEIFESYRTDDTSKYLLNFIKRDQPSQKYIKELSKRELKRNVNPYLKEIMTTLGIHKHITFYCARHSFATHLKFNNVPIEAIREALGHHDIKSTMSYLNSLPDNKLDKIIDEVIN